VANDMPISKEKLRSMGMEEEDWTDADEAEAAAEAEMPKQKLKRRRGACIASKGASPGMLRLHPVGSTVRPHC